MRYNNNSLSRLERKPFDYYELCYERFKNDDHVQILEELFYEKLGYKLRVESPHTYNEKLQWLKLYWRDDNATICSDKYEVKGYLKEKGFSDILIDTLGIYNNVDEIEFHNLPSKYVIKATHASGYNLFVSNSSLLDTKRAKNVLNKILNIPYYASKLEWNYEAIKPRLIIEPLLPISLERPLDFKFYCFHGEVEFVEITTACEWDYKFEPREMIVDKSFNRLNFSYSFENSLLVQKPNDFDNMVEIATKLSSPFPHVRIDLLNPVDGIIKFGEFTFFPSAGFGIFNPREIDTVMGNRLHLELI